MTLYQNKYRIESARLQGWNYGTPGWYFVTMCVRNHACSFGEITNSIVQLSPAGRIAKLELLNLPGLYQDVSIDRFIVMPNHVHMIVMIGGEHRFSPNPRRSADPSVNVGLIVLPPKSVSLSSVVGSYKSGVTRLCHEKGLDFAWQPRFHDHIIRTDASLNAMRDYIENNPANWSKDQENQNRL
jgi:putative transposase